MPDISDLVREYENHRFSQNTREHGIVRFDYFSAWRSHLIHLKNTGFENMPADKFCLNVAKCLLFEFEGTILDEKYFSKTDGLSSIKLLLTKKELDEFASNFIKNNQDTFLSEFSRDDLGKLNGFVTIKEFFIRDKKRMDKLIKSVTGFSKINFNHSILNSLDAIRQINNPAVFNIANLAKDAANAVKSYTLQDYPSSEKSLPELVTPRHIQIELLSEINKTLTSFVNDYTNESKLNSEKSKLANECLNQIKENLDAQIKMAEKNSKEAKFQSLIAVMISLLALLSSMVFGVMQNKNTVSSNLAVDSLNQNITSLIKVIDGKNKLEIEKSDIVSDNEIIINTLSKDKNLIEQQNVTTQGN